MKSRIKKEINLLIMLRDDDFIRHIFRDNESIFPSEKTCFCFHGDTIACLYLVGVTSKKMVYCIDLSYSDNPWNCLKHTNDFCLAVEAYDFFEKKYLKYISLKNKNNSLIK